MKNLLTPPRAALVGAASLTALSLAFSAPAEAVLVNVGGTDYDLTTYNGSYNDNIANECSPGSETTNCLTTTPWWGNNTLASQLAEALYSTAPTPNGGLPGNTYLSAPIGSFFAWGFNGTSVQVAAYSSEGPLGITRNPSIAYNYATPVPLESDALPVVGAAAFMAGGIWWKKKRAGAKALDLSPTDTVKG